MHLNSLFAFKQIVSDGSLNSRLLDVLECVRNSPKPLRDWDVLQKLFPGREDLNLVRPRLSELHESGHLEEGPVMLSHNGNRNVRTSIATNNEPQQSLF